MSSPDRPHFNQADFLARWMPSSTRAGVILSPSPDLTGTLRHITTSAAAAAAAAASDIVPVPDDSFASDFAPLPSSVDSSCLGADGGALLPPGGERRAGAVEVEPLTSADGGLEGLDAKGSKAQQVPPMMKLEQLRKWQQHMQEQLKASQLEELLLQQEEQQRQLEKINGCKDGTKDQWKDDQELSVNVSHFLEQDVAIIQGNVVKLHENSRRADNAYHDRPVGGHKKTFEELLEEQLRIEEQRLKSVRQQERENDQALPKRAFLKRGQGLARFANTRKASLPKTEEKKDSKFQPQARVITRSNSEPAAFQRDVPNGPQRLPVQRKTAKLNKENRLKGLISPPPTISVESKAAQTKVLGCHQRQNTERPELSQPEPPKSLQFGQRKVQKNRKAVLSPPPPPPRNPVTKHGGIMVGPQQEAEDTVATEAKRGPTVGSDGGRPALGGQVPQDSFELSFQEKLQHWESERQMENMELGEFELLEQAAEELSFSSNSSFVAKVLQMDRLNDARGLKPRRLSSTPIKSPPKSARQRCASLDGGGFSAAPRAANTVTAREEMPTEQADQVDQGNQGNQVRKENKEEDDNRVEEEHRNSDATSFCISDLEDEEAAVDAAPPFPGALCFPAQPQQLYDRRSYQDPSRDAASDETQDEESDGALSTAESTLTEDKDGRGAGVVFDDDETWYDPEDTPTASPVKSEPPFEAASGRISPPERRLYRSAGASRAVDVAARPANQEPDAAATRPSQLMVKLFPSLKAKAQNAPVAPPPLPPNAASASKNSEMETGQSDQSRLLRERLAELEIEIERFKRENAALTKLRQENERNQEILRKERAQFEQTKAEELAKFEEYKKEQSSKLQKERKVFEKHLAAARAMPDKKEREEIQALRQQLSALQEELRGKESRWASMHTRLRQQNDSLRQENTSLKDEVRTLERLRLSFWKKPAPANAVKETKESPPVADNSVPSVTKGVKFASPLDSRGSSSSPPQSSSTAAARRNSREGGQCASAGIKSSLRRPSGPATSSSSSSSSWSGRRSLDISPTASKSQENPVIQDSSQSSSPKSDCLPTESECSETDESESAEEVIKHPDGKVEKVLASGERLIIFPNGTKKEVSADGLTVKVIFFNGDTKEVTADQRVIYYYAVAQTTHVTYPDGLEVLHFPNNQTEKHFPDGRKEITFPDQTVKNMFPDGREESVLMDGTIIQVSPDGTKEIHFNTGQKEIHTTEYKKREYPDGTVKTVYADGRQETRYPTGRLRIKDKDGNVVADNQLSLP